MANIEQNKINALVDRYRLMLEDAVLTTDITAIDDPEATPEHLLWMLDEIETNDAQSLTKKHRWLSWVSACLILVYRVTTVTKERNATRGTLSGS